MMPVRLKPETPWSRVKHSTTELPLADEQSHDCPDKCKGLLTGIAPDKAAYCVFTHFHGLENAIELISVRTKTQSKSLILNSELFCSV